MPSHRVLAAVAFAAGRCALSEVPMADELSLVQRALDPEADMPKLRCDMTNGCHYEGLPPRPQKTEKVPMFPSLFPGVDFEQLKKLVASPPDFSKMAADFAKHLPAPAPGAQQAPFQMPDLSKLMPNMPAPAPFDFSKLMPNMPAAAAPKAQQPPFQMPDLSKIMQDAAKFMPTPAPSAQQAPFDLAKIMQHLSPPAPNAQQPPFQLPDLAKIMQHLPTPAPKAQQPPFQMPDLSQIMKDAAKFMPTPAPNAQQAPFQMPDFSQLAKGLAALAAPAAAASALQVEASPAEDEGSDRVYFLPDNGMVCLQGTAEQTKAALAKLKSSPLAGGYAQSEAKQGSCSSAGYPEGPQPDKCLPSLSLHFSKSHIPNPLSELKLMWTYSRQHGAAAASEGMKQLCSPN